MRRLSLLVVPPCAALLVGIVFAPPQPVHADPFPQATDFEKTALPFLKQHCVSCHGDKKPKGDLSLTPVTDEAALLKDRKRWQRLLDMVHGGEMPPEEKPRPKPADVAAFVKTIQDVFARADRTATRDPGRVTARRLNKVEYANTIRDLVGVDFNPAEDFPADDVGYGFDNIGDVLTLSPILMERYLAAAEAIVTRAVLTEKPPPPTRRVVPNFLVPRLARNDRFAMAFTKNSTVTVREPHKVDEDGDYILRMRGAAIPDGDTPARFALIDNDAELKTFEVKKAEFQPGKPPSYEVKFALKKGEHKVGVKMLSDFKAPEPVESANPPAGQRPKAPGVYVATLELEGPLDVWPLLHRRIMTTTAREPREQARDILTRFAARAYRRPVEPSDVDRLLKLVDATQAKGGKWEEGIQVALQAVLVSPKFLFRIERDDNTATTGSRPIDDFALASRLSYFLWSTMPDDELLAVAAKGRLSAEVDVQVRRMMKDPKALALGENFATQWLQLRNLKTMTPDPKLFPQYDDRLRDAMLKETELFFEAVVREDRSLLDLIDADFTYLNRRLSKHYGIDGVYGDKFQRVTLTDGLRGGVLTQASVLTVTSNPTRTSPVKRGKWVLEQILGTPPPEPPPNVPELAVDAKAQLTGSLRQRMEQHRKDPHCAVCHEQMDAMGFAFENFDAVGAFRTKDGTFPIDASGKLAGGWTFDGPKGLKAILKEKKELFARCLTEKMLTYALGRGLESYDRPAVDAIVQALARNNYRFSTLVTEIVKSDPFRLRRGMGRVP